MDRDDRVRCGEADSADRAGDVVHGADGSGRNHNRADARSIGNAVQAENVYGNISFSSPVNARSAIPRQLPPSVPDFINRERELFTLDSILGNRAGPSASTTAVVVGPPGAGKSTFLTHWATRVQRDYPDGQLYVDMHSYSAAEPVSAERALDSFLRSLGVPAADLPRDLAGQVALYRTLVSERRLLILVDNADTPERVRPLLIGPGKSRLVIASRSRMSGLAIREGAPRMALDILSPDAAAILMRSVVGEERSAREPASVEELCRLCGYLPLAVRLVAERAARRPRMPLEQLVAELSEPGRLEVLTAPDDDLSAVWRVFSWSYNLLPPDAATIFRMCGLHPGPDIGESALQALSGLPKRVLRQAVDILIEAHLVQETAYGRLSMHDLLHDYARGLADAEDPADAREAARSRLFTWYMATTVAADAALTPGGSGVQLVGRPEVQAEKFASFDAAINWFEAERANILAVVRHARESSDYEAAAAIARFTWAFYNTKKYWFDWIQCDEIAIEASRRTGDKSHEPYLLMSLGTAYRHIRRSSAAIECHTRAAEIFEEQRNFVGLGYARNNLANIQSDIGEYDDALASFHRALDAFRQLTGSAASARPRGEAITRNSMAATYNAMGNHQEAATSAEAAGRIWDELHDQHGSAFTLHNLGLANFGLGKADAATRYLTEAAELRREITDHYGQARSLTALGECLMSLGRSADARERWAEALVIFHELRAPEAADVAARLGLPPEA